MGENSIAMGVEKRKIRYRFNRYLFPFVECAITLYTESGGPVPISDIADCMRDNHGITGVRNVYEGRDAALENGYVIDLHIGRRKGYEPTMEGVVNAGLYFGLLSVLEKNELPNVNIFCLLKLLRIALGLAKLEFMLTTLWLNTQVVQPPVKPIKEDPLWDLYVINFIAAKALLGVEVRDLKPMYYRLVMDAIKSGVASLVAMPQPSGGKLPIKTVNLLEPFITKACSII
jgi:hypothetical protein